MPPSPSPYAGINNQHGPSKFHRWKELLAKSKGLRPTGMGRRLRLPIEPGGDGRPGFVQLTHITYRGFKIPPTKWPPPTTAKAEAMEQTHGVVGASPSPGERSTQSRWHRKVH